MNKRIVSRLRAFQQVQRRQGRYHISQLTPHEQAIREHVERGFKSGLVRVPGLLNQENKI